MIETFRDGSRFGARLINGAVDGAYGYGMDLPGALEDLARNLRRETPGPKPAETSRPTQSWLPLSHSPDGPLEEDYTASREVGGADTLVYYCQDGDIRTMFKCVRSSPTREQWYQLVVAG